MDHDPLWETNASKKSVKHFSRRILGPEAYSHPLYQESDDSLVVDPPTTGATGRSNGNGSARITLSRHGGSSRQPKSSRTPVVLKPQVSPQHPLPVLQKHLPFQYHGDIFTQRGMYCEASLYLSRLPSRTNTPGSSARSHGTSSAKYRTGLKLAPVQQQNGANGDMPTAGDQCKTPNIKSQRKSQFALAIESMAANPMLRSTLLNDNVIPSIMTLSRTRDMATMSACIAALCHLSHESDGRAAILSNVNFTLIPTHIITLNLDKRVMYNVMAILTNLTMEDSFESVFVREKGLEGLMKHRKSCEQAETMCMVALFNLTCPNYSYPRIDDVIHALVDHARIHVDHSNASNSSHGGNSNPNNNSANINAVHPHHSTVGYDVDMLGRAIYNVCSTRMNQNKFAENETMNTLRHLMQHSTPYVRFQTLCALWQLADVATCRKAMMRFECVHAIVHEMKRINHEDESLQCALAILLKLCVDPGAREQMAQANALDILGELAQRTAMSSTNGATTDIDPANTGAGAGAGAGGRELPTSRGRGSPTPPVSSAAKRTRQQDIQLMVFRLMALILAMESNISLVQEKFFTFLVDFDHLKYPQMLSKYVLFCLASIFSWNNLNGSCCIGFDASSGGKTKHSSSFSGMGRLHNHRNSNHSEHGSIARAMSVLSLDDLLDEPTLLQKVYRHVAYEHFAMDSIETQLQMLLLYNLSFGYSRKELAALAASRLQQLGTIIATTAVAATPSKGSVSTTSYSSTTTHPGASAPAGAGTIPPVTNATGPSNSPEKHHMAFTISLMAQTLFSLCQDYDAHGVLWEQGDLMHLIANLTTQSDEPTRNLLFELICALFDTKQLDENYLIEMVKSLFPLIVSHCSSKSPQLRALCSACLARFASIRECRVMMAKNGLINALAVLASEQDAQTLRFCVHAYSCLSRDQVLCATLINNGIVKSLTFLAAAPEEAVRRACAMTLCNLSTTEENIGALVKHGAFRALLVISCVKSNDAETRRICMKSVMNLLRLPSNLPQMCHDGLLWAFAMFARDVEVRDFEIMADAFEALAFYPLTREGVIKPAILSALLPILASPAASLPTKVKLLKGIANALQLPSAASVLMLHGVLDLLCDLIEQHAKDLQPPSPPPPQQQQQQQQQQPDAPNKPPEEESPGAGTASSEGVASLTQSPSASSSSSASVTSYSTTISMLATPPAALASSYSSSMSATSPRLELPAIVSQILLLLFQHCPDHEMDFAVHPKFLGTVETLLGHAYALKDSATSDTIRYSSFLLLFMTCHPTCCQVLAHKSHALKQFVPELIIRAASEPSRVLLRCLYHVSCHEAFLMDIYCAELLQAITVSVSRHWDNKEAMKLCAKLLRNFATNEHCHVLLIHQNVLGLFKKLFEMEDANAKEDIAVALCNLFLGKVNSTELLSNAILHVVLWLTANPALENLLLCSTTIRKLAIPPGNIEMLVDGGVISHIVPLMQNCSAMAVKQNCVATLCLLARKSGIAMILASYGVISVVLNLLETATKENTLDAQLEGMCVDLLTILAEHVRSDVPEESKLSSTLYRLIENDDRVDKTFQQSAFWQNDRGFLNRDGTKVTDLQPTKLSTSLVQTLQDLKLVKGTLFPVATQGYSVDFSNHSSSQLNLRELEPMFPDIDTLGDSVETHVTSGSGSSGAGSSGGELDREHGGETEFQMMKRSSFASISVFVPPKMHNKVREPYHPLTTPLHYVSTTTTMTTTTTGSPHAGIPTTGPGSGNANSSSSSSVSTAANTTTTTTTMPLPKALGMARALSFIVEE